MVPPKNLLIFVLRFCHVVVINGLVIVKYTIIHGFISPILVLIKIYSAIAMFNTAINIARSWRVSRLLIEDVITRKICSLLLTDMATLPGPSVTGSLHGSLLV